MANRVVNFSQKIHEIRLNFFAHLCFLKNFIENRDRAELIMHTYDAGSCIKQIKKSFPSRINVRTRLFNCFIFD